MKNIVKFLVIASLFSIIAVPVLSMAQDNDNGLVPCGTQKSDIVNDAAGHYVSGGKITNPCGFKDILTLINGVIQFILKKMVLPIAAIMFAYAGFLYLTAGGSTSQSEKAKGVFVGVAIGLVIAVAAFLIISTLLSLLGYDGAWIGF